MVKKRRPKERRCIAVDESQRGDVSLAVVPGEQKSQPIRTSRNARRRAIVLACVQLAMIAHVVQWKLTGRTLTPVEPSEAVQTMRDGVLNAGFIFFGIALLSTLVLWMGLPHRDAPGLVRLDDEEAGHKA